MPFTIDKVSPKRSRLGTDKEIAVALSNLSPGRGGRTNVNVVVVRADAARTTAASREVSAAPPTARHLAQSVRGRAP